MICFEISHIVQWNTIHIIKPTIFTYKTYRMILHHPSVYHCTWLYVQTVGFLIWMTCTALILIGHSFKSFVTLKAAVLTLQFEEPINTKIFWGFFPFGCKIIQFFFSYDSTFSYLPFNHYWTCSKFSQQSVHILSLNTYKAQYLSENFW